MSKKIVPLNRTIHGIKQIKLGTLISYVFVIVKNIIKICFHATIFQHDRQIYVHRDNTFFNDVFRWVTYFNFFNYPLFQNERTKD